MSSIPSMLPMTLQRCTTPSSSSCVIFSPRLSPLTMVNPMNPNWASAMSNCVGSWTPASVLLLKAMQCFLRTIFKDSKNLKVYNNKFTIIKINTKDYIISLLTALRYLYTCAYMLPELIVWIIFCMFWRIYALLIKFE